MQTTHFFRRLVSYVPLAFNTAYVGIGAHQPVTISTLSWSALVGCTLNIALPLATNTLPQPLSMLVLSPDGLTQVGQADFNAADLGASISIVYNQVTYAKTLGSGTITLS